MRKHHFPIQDLSKKLLVVAAETPRALDQAVSSHKAGGLSLCGLSYIADV